MTKPAAVLAALTLTAASLRGAQPPAAALRSFYIASRTSFGIASDDIVSVEAAGRDTRVRAMRLVSVSEACPWVRVAQAAERLVRNESVHAVASLPLCDMTQQRVDRALAQSRTPRVDDVDCG